MKQNEIHCACLLHARQHTTKMEDKIQTWSQPSRIYNLWKGHVSSITPRPIIWQNPHMVIQVPAVSIPPQTAEKNHPVRKPPGCRCSCKVRENDEGLGDKLKVFGSFTESPHCILVSLTLSHNSFSFIQSKTNYLYLESLLCLPPWGLIPSIFPLFTPTCIFIAFYWIFLIST